jgi:hypothetical protein
MEIQQIIVIFKSFIISVREKAMWLLVPGAKKPSYATGEYNQVSKSCVCQIYTRQQKTFSITLTHSAFLLKLFQN